MHRQVRASWVSLSHPFILTWSVRRCLHTQLHESSATARARRVLDTLCHVPSGASFLSIFAVSFHTNLECSQMPMLYREPIGILPAIPSIGTLPAVPIHYESALGSGYFVPCAVRCMFPEYLCRILSYELGVYLVLPIWTTEKIRISDFHRLSIRSLNDLCVSESN
jgi:hypothetical protein